MALIDAKQFNALISGLKKAKAKTVYLSYTEVDFLVSYEIDGATTMLSMPADADAPSISVEVSRSDLSSLSFLGDNLKVTISESEVSFEDEESSFRSIPARLRQGEVFLPQDTHNLVPLGTARTLIAGLKFITSAIPRKSDAIEEGLHKVFLLAEDNGALCLYSSNRIGLARVEIGKVEDPQLFQARTIDVAEVRSCLSIVPSMTEISLGVDGKNLSLVFERGVCPITSQPSKDYPLADLYARMSAQENVCEVYIEDKRALSSTLKKVEAKGSPITSFRTTNTGVELTAQVGELVVARSTLSAEITGAVDHHFRLPHIYISPLARKWQVSDIKLEVKKDCVKGVGTTLPHSFIIASAR